MENFFTRVKDRLSTMKWQKFEYGDARSACLAGMMGITNQAVRSTMSTEDIKQRMDAYWFTTRQLGMTPEHWNDGVCRDQQQFEETLDALAVAWEEHIHPQPDAQLLAEKWAEENRAKELELTDATAWLQLEAEFDQVDPKPGFLAKCWALMHPSKETEKELIDA